jgi:hypothetical protein
MNEADEKTGAFLNSPVQIPEDEEARSGFFVSDDIDPEGLNVCVSCE